VKRLVLALICFGVAVLLLSLLLEVEASASNNRLYATISGTIERVSISSTGEEGNSNSQVGSISADGRYAAFYSYASNLVISDTNEQYDIFIHERISGITERINLGPVGQQTNHYSGSPVISADGRYVAYSSQANNLVISDTNGYNSDVFVYDHETGITALASINSSGEQGNDDSSLPKISPDGRYVVFHSTATNLVVSDTNGWGDVFVHDRQTGITERVSVSSNGEQGNLWSNSASISGDGRYVAFESVASNFVLGDSNNNDVFIHDRQTGETVRISTGTNGEQPNGDSNWPVFSANGRYVAFYSDANNLVTGDTNSEDVFIYDRVERIITLVSLSLNGQKGNDDSLYPSISADGRYVAFRSRASNLVLGDTNGLSDIFVRDLFTGINLRMSVSSTGQEGNGSSLQPAISSHGQFVVFWSEANNLVAGDTNEEGDVFIREWQLQSLFLPFVSH
jgi:hypothetical protein